MAPDIISFRGVFMSPIEIIIVSLGVIDLAEIISMGFPRGHCPRWNCFHGVLDPAQISNIIEYLAEFKAILRNGIKPIDSRHLVDCLMEKKHRVSKTSWHCHFKKKPSNRSEKVYFEKKFEFALTYQNKLMYYKYLSQNYLIKTIILSFKF
jgi:hypothetical protein